MKLAEQHSSPLRGAEIWPLTLKGSESDFRAEHPRTAELVIEVCVTSHDYDRSKIRAYADAGVKEFWLVLAPERQIEVHRRPRDGGFGEQRTYGPGAERPCAATVATGH